MSDRFIMITGFAVMGLCLLGIAYQIVVVSRMLEHMQVLTLEILKLH